MGGMSDNYSLVTTCLLLKYSSYLTFSCPDLPLLSHLPDCPGLFSSEVLGLTDSHAWIYLLGSLTVLLMATLHTMVIFLTENTRTGGHGGSHIGGRDLRRVDERMEGENVR